MAGAVLLPALLGGVALGILVQDGTPAVSFGSVALCFGGVVFLLAGRLVPGLRLPAVVCGALVLGIGLGAWRGAATVLPDGPDSLAARTGGATYQLTGTLGDEPRPRGERQQAVLEDVAVSDGGGAPTVATGRLLAWLPRSIGLQVGDRIRFEARLEEPRDFDGFAYREYLARQGIAAIASARRVEVVGHQLGPLAETLAALRRQLLRGLQSLIPEPEAALAAGILLGVRSSMAPEVNDAFAAAGLTHVVAISGWNIAIVVGLVAALTRPLARRPGGRVVAVAVTVVAVGAYVLLTGASPSVVRAALMAGGLVLARIGGSRAHAISALVLAALLMLLAAPPVLWDVGFQLSALATAGLIWFGAAIERRLARWPGLVREPVALTLAAQVTTLPVILLNFERLSLVAPIANVLVVPLVPIVMLAAALASVTGTLIDASRLPLLGDLLSWIAGGFAWLYLRAMIGVGQLAASVPFASVEVAAPAWLAAAWYPLLPLLRRRLDAPPVGSPTARPPDDRLPLAAQLARPAPLACVTGAILVVLTVASRPDGRLHLAMLDVGQGDAVLVRAPSGATLLVDGGPDPDLAMRRLGEELPFWQRRIDILLLTHPHEDHVAGLLPALERYRVGLVIDPGRAYPNPTYARFLADAAAEPDARLVGAHAGMHLALDAATSLTILFPADRDLAAPLPDGDINNASVVAVLAAGEVTVLLTGDAEAAVERLLVSRGLLDPVDVLKVGHHGSDSSTTVQLLAATRPTAALISVGNGNEYGHPHAATLAHLNGVPGLTVRRTDLEGTIRLAWDMPSATGDAAPGSIGPWPSRPVSARTRSWRATSFPRGSWSTPAAWRAWRRRRRAGWRPPGCRWMPHSSRSPPCCTISTSHTSAAAASHTGSWPPAG